MRQTIMVLLLAACGGEVHDTADPMATTCDSVACPGGSRVEWQAGASVAVTCEWDCLLMDGQPTHLRRTWIQEPGECYAIAAEWREPVGACDG